MSKRPVIKIEPTPTDKAIDLAGWIVLAFAWGMVLYHYPGLPQTIPTHFNFSGDVDRSGDKSTLLILPIIGSVVFTLISFLNRYPHRFNYATQITKENAAQNYRFATRMLRYLKLGIAVLFAIIIYRIILIATG